MRRKGSRTSVKASPEKSKQPDTPLRKSRRNTKRQRKSSSSEHSEEETEVKLVTQPEIQLAEQSKKHDLSDTEKNENVENTKLNTDSTRPSVSPDRLSKNLNKSGSIRNEDESSQEEISSRLGRRGTPKDEDSINQENEDAEDIKGKGKSKSKHKSNIDSTQSLNESETHTQSEISENVQVTPQSPQTNIDNPVVNENVTVIETIETTKDLSVNETETKQNEESSRTTSKKVEHHPSKSSDDSKNSKLKRKDNKSSSCIKEKLKDKKTEKSSEHEQFITKDDDDIPLRGFQSNETAEKGNLENSCNEKSMQDKNNVIEIRKDDCIDGIIKDKDNVCKPYDHKENKTIKLRRDNSAEKAELEAENEEEYSKDNSEKENIFINKEESPEHDGNCDKKTRKVSKQKIEIIRSYEKFDNEERTAHRRHWGYTSVGLELFPCLVNVDLESVKSFCSNVEFLEESEVKLESELKTRRKSLTDQKEQKKTERKISLGDMDRLTYDSQTSEISFKSNHSVESEVDNSNIIAMNRKISIVDDSASKLKPPPSPAKNPVSDVLYITNLVRPFTLKQLKELLERTGKIVESGFWTDRIKSKCYVQYETNDEAEATRNALHGIHWPIGNGKKLIIEYATAEDLENARNPPTPPLPLPVIPDIKYEKENHESLREKERRKQEDKVKEREKENEREKDKKRHDFVREWDVGKEELHRKRSRSRDRSSKRKHSRHSPSPVDDFISRKQKKLEEQIPQKLMDDLFQKTKVTPSIYWQPLTPEEIATKQQQRLERMAEHKRRMEETSRSRADYGRGGPYRRRYD